MFVLNNRIEKTESGQKHKTESVVSINSNHAGIAPLSAQIPDKTEGSLPIKLISNLNSDFLYFINNGYEFRNEFKFLFLQKAYLNFCHKIQAKKLISYLITARSKDIQ